MIIMSADLGLARTGVAVSDNGESFAFPKTVITEYNTQRLIEKLITCSNEYGAELVVMGLPKNMDGTEGERANKCRAIAKEFEEKSGIKTVLWDERCTTVTAHNILNMNDKRGKKRKETVDAVAAVIILENYLQARKNR
ncbi:MAG: Holliday junction resolvase RuvX [Clostridia bacterium]|nr:Holliday junction resolvase RuvX [Clostridia bacterium]